MNLNLKRPCRDCPFKNDVSYQRGWLGAQRSKEIINTLFVRDGTFACHKTIGGHESKQQHCAGAMILMERQGKANQYMRIMERVGMYDRNALDMNTPVFDTPEQFVAWHSGSEVITEYQERQRRRQEDEANAISEELELQSPANSQDWKAAKNAQMEQLLTKLESQGIKRQPITLGIAES